MTTRQKIVQLGFASGVLLGAVCPKAHGVVQDISILGAMMLQPTSNYYHASYGALATIGMDDDTLFFRVGLIERPKFNSAGFEDQESHIFAGIGTSPWQKKPFRLRALLGYGSMAGFIQQKNNPSAEKRSFQLTGATVAMEFSATYDYVDIGAGHQQFIGLADQIQTDAYVAWPYSFIYTKIGFRY